MSADWHIIGNSKSNNAAASTETSLQTKTLQKVQWFCNVSDLYGREEGYFQLIHANYFHGKTESDRFTFWRRRLTDCVNQMYWNACRTCSTIICPCREYAVKTKRQCLIIKDCWLLFYAGPRYIWARLDHHQVCIPSKGNVTWAIFTKINTGTRDPHSHYLFPVPGTMFERGRGKQRSWGEGLFFQLPLFHVHGLNLADISILSWDKSRLDHTEQ